MAQQIGTATIDFGAAPGGNCTSVDVTGQTAIASTSAADAWIMYDSTTDHNGEEHLLVPIRLCCGNLIANTGFTIYAESDMRLTGTFKVRWCFV